MKISLDSFEKWEIVHIAKCNLLKPGEIDKLEEMHHYKAAYYPKKNDIFLKLVNKIVIRNGGKYPLCHHDCKDCINIAAKIEDDPSFQRRILDAHYLQSPKNETPTQSSRKQKRRVSHRIESKEQPTRQVNNDILSHLASLKCRSRSNDDANVDMTSGMPVTGSTMGSDNISPVKHPKDKMKWEGDTLPDFEDWKKEHLDTVEEFQALGRSDEALLTKCWRDFLIKPGRNTHPYDVFPDLRLNRIKYVDGQPILDYNYYLLKEWFRDRFSDMLVEKLDAEGISPRQDMVLLRRLPWAPLIQVRNTGTSQPAWGVQHHRLWKQKS